MEFVIYVNQTQKRSFIYSFNAGFHSFILKVENALNIILRDNFNSTQSIKLHMKHIILGFLHADQNIQTLISFVLHVFKMELWKQRNLVKFENRIICENRLFEQFRNKLISCSQFLYHTIVAQKHKMSPVKGICVFEHSVMTNFNCACPAIQRGQGSGFLSEGSSWLTACMSEQRRFRRDCADAQARLNLRCSHRR